MENESKMAGENNKHVIWVLLLSLLALITSFQRQLVVLYNLIFQLQQQQAMIMHLTHSAAVARHFHLSRRRSTRGLGERLWRSSESLESVRGNARRNCRPLAAEYREHPAAAMFVFLSLVPGTSERRQFTWC